MPPEISMTPSLISRIDFWQLLTNGVDAITEVSAERFKIDSLYDPTAGTYSKVVTRYGGLLAQVDTFDASFFGISFWEAKC